MPAKKRYTRLPETIEAYYFETGGTYEVFGTKIEVRDDTYVYLRGRNVMTVRGEEFRKKWILGTVE